MGMQTGADGARNFAELHARLLRDSRLQFDVGPPPSKPEIKPFNLPKWLLDALDHLGKAIGDAFKAVGPVATWVFWVGAVAVGLLLVWLLWRDVISPMARTAGRGAPERPNLTDWRPDPVKARALLENADRLAQAGRFDMAVRLILHRGLEDIEARRPRTLRPALTAREIAALPALPDAVRLPFARMAAVVEYSAFGGRAIGAEAFGQCRAAYEAFALETAWR